MSCIWIFEKLLYKTVVSSLNKEVVCNNEGKNNFLYNVVKTFYVGTSLKISFLCNLQMISIIKKFILCLGNHPVKRRGMASVAKCHKCNGSGVIFIGGAKQQLQNQDKPFRCNICNGTFSRYSSLWSHKRLHSGEKNFKCNICSLAFAKAAYLKNHTRIHTGRC